MAFKVLLDVNILLDFTLQRTAYQEAKTIITWTEQGTIKGFISPSVVQICAYWIAKSYGSTKAKEILGLLLGFLDSLEISHEQVLAAVHSSMSDVEDALLYYTALHHKLDIIISRDQHFQQSGLPSLPVLSPKEFIAFIQKKSF
ncbi:type II toxin-antitoxin system VapC family toxin [Olivibacter sp. SDN3]|uniref:type II toxin-antitoxin system VapC family toxin n=1 Tax=Olivibacter sp. SDN3 TaxID=2764720 RepID=UPI00165170FC|nr:PIN domain-containing protein [Olivibacter sp. SDN3]QNL50956.1 type II toxin-antitoxin system VapC family toxin [Olivibacter sp. SDN3]